MKRWLMAGGGSTAGLTLGLAALLGLLAEPLFPAGPEGPGFAIWILLLGAAAVLVARQADPSTAGPIAGWSAVAAAAAAGIVLRDTPVLVPAMWLVLLTAASMTLLRASGKRIWRTRPADHLLGLALVPARAAMGPVPLAAGVPAPDGSRRRLAAVGRGALLAAPLLLLFGALFASADAGFNRYAVHAATFWSEDALAHLAFALAFGWIAAGLLSGARAKRLPDPLAGLSLPRLGPVETAVSLGLLALLFLTFVAFQLGYLFGGARVIEATSGLTVAEYARRGFFELLVVGIGTIGVLLLGDALTTARRLFRGLAGLLVACVLVILLSAVHRLSLYTGAFGLTVDRITAAVVMAWVAVVLVLFAATVLRERPRRFASGAVLAGIAAAFALVLLNPAGMAARSALDRVGGDAEPDASYLAGLGADAVPTLVQRMDALPPAARCELGEILVSRWGGEPGADGDWRRWNAARAAARGAVREAGIEAARAGC